jgi:hypothetical protein
MRTGDTADTLVGIDLCTGDNNQITFRMVTVDPATGKVMINRRLDGLPTSRNDLAHLDIQPAGAGGTALRYNPQTPENRYGSNVVYVDAATGVATEFPDSTIGAFEWPAGDFTVFGGRENSVGLYGPDGAQRCSFDGLRPRIVLERFGYAEAAWLDDQFVYFDYSHGHSVLRSVERSDCKSGVERELSGNVMSMAAAPGVLAVVTSEDWSLFLEGYA